MLVKGFCPDFVTKNVGNCLDFITKFSRNCPDFMQKGALWLFPVAPFAHR